MIEWFTGYRGHTQADYGNKKSASVKGLEP